MSTLGTNAIRVYHVDATEDHTDCMKAFADVGIYLFVDLDTFNTYILGVSGLLFPIGRNAVQDCKRRHESILLCLTLSNEELLNSTNKYLKIMADANIS
jgi:hypothetical protein